MEKKADITNIASQKLDEYLKGQKKRRTPERFEILNVMTKLDGLFSVDQLNEEMQHQGAFRVSRSTIFNTLELFTEAQIVTKHTLERTAMYECTIVPSPMVCLVCQKCDTITKLDDTAMKQWLQDIKVKQFHIKQPVLYLHGLCKKCNAALNRKTNKKKK